MDNAAVIAEFDRLISQERDRSLEYAYQFTRCHDSAEDAVQEASIRAWKGFDRYDRSRPFGPWLRVILSRALVDHYRLRQNKDQVFCDPETVAKIIEDRQGSETQPAADTLVENVLEALQELPEDERAVIEKRFLQEKTRGRVAAELCLKQRAVDKCCRAGMERLRVLVGLKQILEAGPAPGSPDCKRE